MAKTKISEFSATPANNTDIDSINIAEGCAPSGINDAIRELMSQLKDFQTGAVGDSFNGPVGTSTAAAGAFTTLTASSTLNVTGVATLGAGAILNTPASVTLTNATGLPIATGVSGLGTGIATFLATPSSANLIAAVTNETGTGSLVFATSPTLVTPALGTPTSGVATNLTGLPLTTGVTGTLPTANGGTNLTSFTSGGVVYASSSSALATGSALTFDGTSLTALNNASAQSIILSRTSATARNWALGIDGDGGFRLTDATGSNVMLSIIPSGVAYLASASELLFKYNTSVEGMRLTSNGLGIGTSSPSVKLEVAGNAKLTGTNLSIVPSTATSAAYLLNTNTGGNFFLGIDSSTGASFTGTAYGRFLYSGGAYPMVFLTNDLERARIDSSGNMGLGVTPSAWASDRRTYQVGRGGALTSGTGAGFVTLSSNTYYDGTNYRYIATDFSVLYAQTTGQHQWLTAASGTAGGTVTFTQAMTLTASGNLGIGSTGPVSKLEVSNSGVAALIIGYNNTSNNYYDSNTHYFRAGNSSTEYARIDSSGNLCIGTTSASAKLTIGGSGANRVAMTGSTGTLYVGYDGANDALQVASNTYVKFQTGSSYGEAARIDSSGNLLVGTTSYSGSTNGNYLMAGAADGTFWVSHASGTSSGKAYLNFQYNGTNIGSITQSGTTAVLYNTTSDQRLKENIADADSASSLIDALQVRKFDWKSDGSHQRYGFVAQELVTVAPEAVHQPEDPEEMMAVDYSKLVPMLVKEIQSLRKRLADAGI